MPEEPQSLREQVETLPSRKGGFVVAAILITCTAIAGAFVFVRPPVDSVSATTISSAVAPAKTPRLHAHEPKSTSRAVETATSTSTANTSVSPTPPPAQVAKAKPHAKPARPKLPSLPADKPEDAPRAEPEPPPLPDFPIPPPDPN